MSGDDEKKIVVKSLEDKNLMTDAMNNLTPEQLSSLREEAAKKALDLQAQRAEQDIRYEASSRDIREHVRTWDALDRSDATTKHTVNTTVNTGTGKTRIESSSSKPISQSCFVATAAYGDDPSHKNVVFLRNWRDTVLVEYKLGRMFIEWYWKAGPKLASWVSGRKVLMLLSKLVIGTIVFFIGIVHN